MYTEVSTIDEALAVAKDLLLRGQGATIQPLPNGDFSVNNTEK